MICWSDYFLNYIPNVLIIKIKILNGENNMFNY